MARRKPPAPIYTATDALNAHGDMRPRAKRFTLTECQRQMAALKANIDRLTMRVSKVQAKLDAPSACAEDAARKAHLQGILSSSQARYRELVAVFEAKGGTRIHEA